MAKARRLSAQTPGELSREDIITRILVEHEGWGIFDGPDHELLRPFPPAERKRIFAEVERRYRKGGTPPERKK